MANMYLYHYTSEDCINGILRDKRIRQTPSYSSYAHYGQGVYLTSMHPNVGRSRLLTNNRIGTNRSEVLAKTTHYISFAPGALLGVQDKTGVSGRDVYLYPYDIDLNRVAYQVGMVTAA